MKRSPGLATPREQLLRAQPMAPSHLRHADAARQTLHHDAGLVLARPSTASANARDQFDPPHVRDAAVTFVRLASKFTLKRNVKIIAHGSALRHNPDTTETWERSPAYIAQGMCSAGSNATTRVRHATRRRGRIAARGGARGGDHSFPRGGSSTIRNVHPRRYLRFPSRSDDQFPAEPVGLARR